METKEKSDTTESIESHSATILVKSKFVFNIYTHIMYN